MSKLQKRLIVVFCIGVFLCGIGAGVAFGEFSALAYGGEQTIGAVDMRTENFDVEFEAGEEPCTIYRSWLFEQRDVQIDNSVPKNTVRFCVSYNAACVKPFAYWEREDEGIGFSYSGVGEESDLQLIMEAKDTFLQNLKESKLVSFDRPAIEKVTVLVNEESVDDVRMLR